jgi:Tol biopolymer transport system component
MVHVRSAATGRVRELKPRLTRISALEWTPRNDALLVSGTSFEGRSGWWRLDLETEATALVEQMTNWGGAQFIGWSSDGAKVYFRRFASQNEAVVVEKAFPSGPERELMREPRAGAPPAGNVPSLSPDGTKMYYRRAVPGEAKRSFAQWAVIGRDIASGAEREITRGQLANLNLSPDGRYFATGSNDIKTGTRALVLVPTDGSQWRELLRVPLPANVIAGTADTNVLAWGGWAPDSRSLFFRKIVNDQTELWWVSLDAPTAPRLVDQAWRAGVARINIDGRSVVFQTQLAPTERSRELWVFENLFALEPKK